MDFSEPKKPRGRPFQKGTSGNAKGKPQGTRNAATLAAEALLDGESEALTRKAIEMAHAGNMAALKWALDRMLPPRRERPLRFELPLKTAADAMTALSRIAEGVGRGELSESEVRTLVGLVHTFREGLAQVETELRLTALEGSIAKIEAATAEKNSPLGNFTRANYSDPGKIT